MAEQAAVIRLEISASGAMRVLSDVAAGFDTLTTKASKAADTMSTAFGEVAQAVRSLQQAQASATQSAQAELSVLQQQAAIQQQVLSGVLSVAEGERQMAAAAIAARTGNEGLAQSLAAAQQQVRANQQAIEEARGSSGSWAQALTSLREVLLSLGVALSVRQIVEYADTWQRLEGRLRLVTSSTQELTAVQQQLFTIAQEARVPFESTVTVFTRMAQATKDL